MIVVQVKNTWTGEVEYVEGFETREEAEKYCRDRQSRNGIIYTPGIIK